MSEPGTWHARSIERRRRNSSELIELGDVTPIVGRTFPLVKTADAMALPRESQPRLQGRRDDLNRVMSDRIGSLCTRRVHEVRRRGDLNERETHDVGLVSYRRSHH
jgi:hypothetical protein